MKSALLTICIGLSLTALTCITVGFIFGNSEHCLKVLINLKYSLRIGLSAYIKSNISSFTDTLTTSVDKYKEHTKYQCSQNGHVATFEEEAEKQFEYIHNKEPYISKTFSYPWKHNKDEFSRAMKRLQKKAATTRHVLMCLLRSNAYMMVFASSN